MKHKFKRIFILAATFVVWFHNLCDLPKSMLSKDKLFQMALYSEQGNYGESGVGVISQVDPGTMQFGFTLEKAYTTSAGAYNTDGTLVRTLWKKVGYKAGSYTAIWDGKDDGGNDVPPGTYQIKMIAHNVQYVWDGAIGNTSTKQSGSNVHKAFIPMHDMAITGTTAFYVAGYNEGSYGFHRFSTSDPRSQTNLIRDDSAVGFSEVDTDGTWVYIANRGGGNHTTFVTAFNVSDNSQATFAQGVSVTLDPNYPWLTYPNVIDLDQSQNSAVNFPTGLAVQTNGSLLAVSHGGLNAIRLFDKRTGALLQTISVTNPQRIKFASNGDLWVITGTTVVRYANVDSSPTVVASIGGLTKPVDVAVNPNDNNMVLVADSGSSQQVKAFSNTGTSLWTYGQAGGYQTNGADVTSHKFWFFDGDTDSTFITFAPDGSFWVGDGGNSRNLHFSATQVFIEQIAFSHYSYCASVDRNNPTRVFNQFLEFSVDYNKPFGRSWKLVKNWGAGLGNGLGGGIGSGYFGYDYGLREVATLSNGRTYAVVYNSTPQGGSKNELVELTGRHLRLTGVLIPTAKNSDDGNRTSTLAPDGSLNTVVSDQGQWFHRALAGFDNAGNPQWGSDTTLATASAGSQDPVSRGGNPGDQRTFITDSQVVVSFDPSKNNGWHLGGVKVGGTQWLWKASPTGSLDNLGTYDIGNGVNYAGDEVSAVGRNIIYGYHGEFWQSGQASQFMHFYDNGLFVGEFGEPSQGHNAASGVIPGFAGNDFHPEVVKLANGETYLYVNDESSHGPQRWHILGANAIRELTAEGSLGSSVLLTDSPQFPVGLTATAGNGQVTLSWSPVNGAASYNVKSAMMGYTFNTVVSSVANTSYTITGLNNETVYSFVVSANTSAGESSNSDQVSARPFDTTVPVHIAGRLDQLGDYPHLLDVSSSAPDSNQPALVTLHQAQGPVTLGELSDKWLGDLALSEIGRRGYVIYNWSGQGGTSSKVLSPFTTTVGSGWQDFSAVSGHHFVVDGVEGTDWGLYPNPTGKIRIRTSDDNFHYLTVFSSAIGNSARAFRVKLTADGQSSPAAQYTVAPEEPGQSHVFQFMFKGNVTLTVDSANGYRGSLKALFLDNAL